MSAVTLSRDEERLLRAFDGSFATWASLGRNSGLRDRALMDGVYGLVDKGLVAEANPQLFRGIPVKGFTLTDSGRGLL